MISKHLGNPFLQPLPVKFDSRVSWQSAAPATGPIPVLRWSDYKAFERTGSRQYDGPRGQIGHRLDQAACAVLRGDDSQLDELHDLIWAFCEQSKWWLAAHGGTAPIDLVVAMTGMTFGFIEAALGPRLDPEVRERMAREVQARVIEPFLNPPIKYWWAESTNNWNAVCHAGVGVAALAFEKNPARLDAVFEKIQRGLPFFLDGFTRDGGCSEGPGYWRYGMTYFAILAQVVRDFTRGETNLASDPKWARVAAYPVAVTVAPGRDLTFSDTVDAPAPLSLAAASMMRNLTGCSDLFALCEFRGGKPVARDLLDLLMCPAEIPAFNPGAWRADAHFPDLAIAKLNGADGLVLGVKAGHNNEHHNHNDVGSFLLFQDGAQWFADPGAPVYSANTFNAHRYESVFTCSRGHSVPVVDGKLQPAGEQFRGTLNLPAAKNAKRAVVEFASAYGVPALARLTREITLSTDAPVMTLDDAFEFNGPGLPVRDVFITAMDVEQRSAAEVVLLHPNGKRGILRALTPGAFSIEVLREESAESRIGQLLRRISFTPETVLPKQTLSFRFEAAR